MGAKGTAPPFVQSKHSAGNRVTFSLRRIQTRVPPTRREQKFCTSDTVLLTTIPTRCPASSLPCPHLLWRDFSGHWALARSQPLPQAPPSFSSSASEETWPHSPCPHLADSFSSPPSSSTSSSSRSQSARTHPIPGARASTRARRSAATVGTFAARGKVTQRSCRRAETAATRTKSPARKTAISGMADSCIHCGENCTCIVTDVACSCGARAPAALVADEDGSELATWIAEHMDTCDGEIAIASQQVV